MICDPCKTPHAPGDCVDVIAGREYPHRVCVCQHKPVGTATPDWPDSSTDPDKDTSAKGDHR